jgi:tetratricopeptide (TPR) repeat protein
MHCVGNQASVARSKGKNVEAKEYFEQYVELAKELRDKNSEALGLGNIGNILTDERRLTESLAFQQRALDLYRKTQNKSGEFRTIGNIGTVYFDMGEYDTALQYFKSALEGHTKIKFPLGMCHWHTCLAESYMEIAKHSSGAEQIESIDRAKTHAANALELATSFVDQDLIARNNKILEYIGTN